MSPRRVVATLLEADDMLPPEPEIDVKALTARAENDPVPVAGVSVAGTYRDFEKKFLQKRLRRDGPEEFFKVDRNTLLVRDTVSGNIAVRFHYTDILTVSPEDRIVFNNGGWDTVTTLARLNDWMPAGWSIYRQSNTWWWNVYRHNDEEANPGYRRLQPYSNGDYITADGTLYPQAAPEFKKVRVSRRAS